MPFTDGIVIAQVMIRSDLRATQSIPVHKRSALMVPTALVIGLIAGSTLRWGSLVIIGAVIAVQGFALGMPLRALGAFALVQVGYAFAAVIGLPGLEPPVRHRARR